MWVSIVQLHACRFFVPEMDVLPQAVPALWNPTIVNSRIGHKYAVLWNMLSGKCDMLPCKDSCS